jgi:hypothetical protein
VAADGTITTVGASIHKLGDQQGASDDSKDNSVEQDLARGIVHSSFGLAGY